MESSANSSATAWTRLFLDQAEGLIANYSIALGSHSEFPTTMGFPEGFHLFYGLSEIGGVCPSANLLGLLDVSSRWFNATVSFP